MTIMYLKGNPVTSSITFYDSVNEVATDASGSVTVTITASDGTTSYGSGTATHGATGVYTFNWTPTTLDTAVTISWTGTLPQGVTTYTQTCDIVGAWPFTIADLRSFHPEFTDTTQYTAATLQDARVAALDIANRRLPTSLVPKFHRHTAVGRDLTLTQSANQQYGGRLQLMLPHRRVTNLKKLTIDGVTQSLTNITVNAQSGIVLGINAGYYSSTFVNDSSVVVAEYEYGYTRTPQEFVQPLMLAATQWALPNVLSPRITGIANDFGMQRVAQPTVAGSTGIPDLDAAIAAHGGFYGLGIGA